MIEKILWWLFPGTLWDIKSREWDRGWKACWDEYCPDLSPSPTSVCDHEWQDARNPVVKDGEICLKCGAVRPGNQSSLNKTGDNDG